MDPLQVAAATRVSPVAKSEKDKIDAFYKDHAFETFHTTRRVLGQFARLLRATPMRLRNTIRHSVKVASTSQ